MYSISSERKTIDPVDRYRVTANFKCSSLRVVLMWLALHVHRTWFEKKGENVMFCLLY